MIAPARNIALSRALMVGTSDWRIIRYSLRHRRVSEPLLRAIAMM